MKEETMVEKEDITSNDGEEIITQPFSPNDIEISCPTMNIGDLLDKIEHNEINLETTFQRKQNLWDNKKKSRLIESILLGLRLPAFYFDKIERKKWDVIDGLQRCCALKDFCIVKKMKLSDLEFLTQLNDKNFDGLGYDLQRDIKMSSLSVNLLETGTQTRAKYILFERLNTGGVILTPQEIRNAIFEGKPVELIQHLVKNHHFLEATDYKIPNDRAEADDFIARFLSFYLTSYDNYQPDLNSFINDNLDKYRNDDIINKTEKDFNQAMKLAYELFGIEAFRKPKTEDGRRLRINKALFEVIAVLFAKLNNLEIDTLKNRKKEFMEEYNILMLKQEYMNSLSKTGSKDSVTTRFGEFKKMIDKVLKV